MPAPRGAAALSQPVRRTCFKVGARCASRIALFPPMDPSPGIDTVSALKQRLGPLQGRQWPIPCARRFTEVELARLRQGLWPDGGEGRWAVWLGGEVLRCWRLPAGVCVYEAPLRPLPEGGAHCPVLHVLDDPEGYARSTSDLAELDRFDGVLALLARTAAQAA